MSLVREPLDQLQIASPCDASWDAMFGDDRVRHCAQCGKNVFNLSALSYEEAQEFVRKHQGVQCVRFYRRADGTVLTDDCPVGLRAVRRAAGRLRAALGGVAAAILVGILGGWLHVDAGRSGRPSRITNSEPLATILDWFGLRQVSPPVIMGAICAPERIDPVTPPLPESEPRTERSSAP